MVLLNSPPGNFGAGDRGIAALPGRETEFRDTFDEALAYAGTLNCQRIHIMSGITKEVDNGQAQRTFLTNLEYALEKVATSGQFILIEPINTRDFPGYF